MITYILSQLRYRFRRSFSVVASVALGTALFIALVALGNGFREASRAPLSQVAADLIITRPVSDAEARPPSRGQGIRLPFGNALISTEEVAQMAQLSDVTAIANVLEFWEFGDVRYQTILGLDASQTDVGPLLAIQEGLITGRIFTAEEQGVAVADRHYAAFFGLTPGDTISIGEQSFDIVGVAEQTGSSQAGVANLYIPLSDAQLLASIEANQVNQIYMRVGSADAADAVLETLSAQFGPLSALSQQSILQVMGGVAQVSARFAEVAGAVGMLAGLVLTWVAMTGLVSERQREVGIMRAVGWKSGNVIRVFLGESILLSLLGGLIGIAIGYFLAQAMGSIPVPTVSLVQEGLPNLAGIDIPIEDPKLTVQVGLNTLLLAVSVALLGGILSGWLSTRQVAALKPANILRKS